MDEQNSNSDPGGDPGNDVVDSDVGSADSGPVTCRPCLGDDECSTGGVGAVCVQYAGSDFCGNPCSLAGICPAGETCLNTQSLSGAKVQVCVPSNGSCGSSGCQTCPVGTTCDPIAGVCQPDTDGGSFGDTDSGSCGPYDPPEMPSCCTACVPGSGVCQANHCYGGYYCNHDTCRCRQRPTDCGTDGGTEGDSEGDTDSGTDGDLDIPTGSVGPNGGKVSRLFFAVVGDTRPSLKDDTPNYPSAIITQIYQGIAAMVPRPQFSVATGDFVFASPSGPEGSAQLQLYVQAKNQFPATVFPTLGNHECTGYTNSNCAGASATDLFQAYLKALVTPLGKSKPYYTVPIDALDESWTAKIVVVACNAWDATQQAWLQGELARTTTYTFVINHEPLGTKAPCDSELQAMLGSTNYNLLIVGHSHTFSHSGKQLIEGVGGAPISGSANYGWATVEQLPAGGFRVTQYDYLTRSAVASFTVP